MYLSNDTVICNAILVYKRKTWKRRTLYYVCLTYIRHLFFAKRERRKSDKKRLGRRPSKKKDSCNFALKRTENNEREYAHKNA